MNKDAKHIIDSYKSVEIPEIDLESKIINEIRMKDNNKLKFNLRTALIICLVLVITSTVVFALSRIIHNADGSHTLVSENEDTSWSVNSSEWENRYDRDEVKMMQKLFDEMYKLEAVGDEAVVGYFKYSEDKPEIFTVLTAEDTYRYDDETLDVLRNHKATPDYTYDIINKLQNEFRINKITYAYSVDPEMIDAIKLESANKSTLGEIYADVIPVKRKFRSLHFDLFSNDMDKFLNISVHISEESGRFSPGRSEMGYETIMIDDKTAMLSKREGGYYYLVTEVNGVGLTISGNPRGNVEHMIELAKQLIGVMENY